MDRKHFFDAVRASIFGGSLSATQVQGMEALLDASASLQVVDQRDIAYILATPMIETGGTFEPIVESLNYSVEALKKRFAPSRISFTDCDRYGRIDGKQKANQVSIANRIYGGAWGEVHLGNNQVGDGWAFRGRGLCQITGRRNYTVFANDLNLDLVNNPDLATRIEVAAKIMVVGMRDGVFTGKKLRDYFTATSTDWTNARRIINGLDRADDIKRFAKLFNNALQAAA